MIIIKLQGGLGNQLFQYATGLAVSTASGMELKLDLTWYDDVPEGVTHRKFELDGFRITAGAASPAEIRRICRTGFSPLITLLGKLGRGRTQIILERGLAYDPFVMHIRGPAYLNGYWQSDKYFRHLRPVLLEEFSLTEDLSSLATPPSRPGCVAVHVRRGDYASNPAVNKIHGYCSIEYYRQAARIIHERVPDAEYRIFSDDPEWAAANLSCFPNAVFVDMPDARRPVADLILMSMHDHFIISNSTFGWWGAWLAMNPEKVVVAPRKWFLNCSYDSSDIIPETWLRI